MVCFNGTFYCSDCFKMLMDFYKQSSIFMQGENLRNFLLDFDMQSIVLFWGFHSSSPDTENTYSNFRQHSSASCLSLQCSEVIQEPCGTSLLGFNHSVCEQLHLPDVTYNCKCLAEQMSVIDTTSFDWRNVSVKGNNYTATVTP